MNYDEAVALGMPEDPWKNLSPQEWESIQDSDEDIIDERIEYYNACDQWMNDIDYDSVNNRMRAADGRPPSAF